MMLILEDGAYVVDRDFQAFLVPNLYFPKMKDSSNPNGSQQLIETLLDGELVIDTVNGHQRTRYLAYDLIYLNGKPLNYGYFERLRQLKVFFKKILSYLFFLLYFET